LFYFTVKYVSLCPASGRADGIQFHQRNAFSCAVFPLLLCVQKYEIIFIQQKDNAFASHMPNLIIQHRQSCQQRIQGKSTANYAAIDVRRKTK